MDAAHLLHLRYSVVDVLCWVCSEFAQYACRIKTLEYRKEIVTDMRDDIMDLLKLFRVRNNGLKPESIVVYRDGVSQGEFKQVCCTALNTVLSIASVLQLHFCTVELLFVSSLLVIQSACDH